MPSTIIGVLRETQSDAVNIATVAERLKAPEGLEYMMREVTPAVTDTTDEAHCDLRAFAQESLAFLRNGKAL